MKSKKSYYLVIPHIITLAILLNTNVYAANNNQNNASPGKLRLQNEENDAKKLEQCIFSKNEMTAALVARDWIQLEHMSQSHINECKNVFGPEDISIAYENIARSNIGLENPEKALLVSETCIKAHYSYPGCHIEKAEALILLNKPNEALKVLETSERLARHALEKAKRERTDAQSSLNKELHDSSIYLHESQIYRIEEMRERIY